MTPETWKKIKEIVADAAEMDAESQKAFLDEHCPAEFRPKVEELLAADNTNAAMLDAKATSMTDVGAPDERYGDRVGPYEITGELGAGGMGVVYLARRADGAFDQTVALKLIKRGMDSDAILRRFLGERQILASLEHPNIAHLIDGGTTDDDLPYFVMEYVEGESINRYADREDLNLDERLDLFRQVC